MNLHKALTHRVRVLALHVIEELGAASPVLVTQRTIGTDNELSLNVVAYHFRVLATMEVIELADQVQRRGATEHIYRINPRSPVPDLLRVTELMERITVASASYLSGELYANGSGPVAIVPVQVDEQGEEDLNELLAGVSSNLKKLAQQCRRRLADSAIESISLRVGLAVYKPDLGNVPRQSSE